MTKTSETSVAPERSEASSSPISPYFQQKNLDKVSGGKSNHSGVNKREKNGNQALSPSPITMVSQMPGALDSTDFYPTSFLMLIKTKQILGLWITKILFASILVLWGSPKFTNKQAYSWIFTIYLHTHIYNIDSFSSSPQYKSPLCTLCTCSHIQPHPARILARRLGIARMSGSNLLWPGAALSHHRHLTCSLNISQRGT